MVVMDGKNIEDIYPMLELAKKDKVSIRFIEEMPFNGNRLFRIRFFLVILIKSILVKAIKAEV